MQKIDKFIGKASFEVIPCNLCGSHDCLNVDIGLSSDISAKFFSKVKSSWVICQSCSLLYQSPRPNSQSWSALYEDSEYRKITGGFTEGTYNYAYIQFDKVRSWFSSTTGTLISKDWPVSFLDYGCGVGGTLKYFRDIGCKDVRGIEVDQACIQAAKDYFGEVVASSFDDPSVQKLKFDLVFTHHCLEHLLDMNTFFVGARKLISDNGYLVIVLPSFWKGTSIYSYGTSMSHNFIVTHDTLKKYLEKHGFEYISHKYSYMAGSDREIWCIARPKAVETSALMFSKDPKLVEQVRNELTVYMPIRIAMYYLPEQFKIQILPKIKKIVKRILKLF